MIIIIEGPDGAGKSMLAKQLAEQTGFTILHRHQVSSDEAKSEMMEQYLDVILRAGYTGQGFILDRCWYSEYVYGNVFGDPHVISKEAILNIEVKLARVGALIIYCTGDKDVLWGRCIARGENYISTKLQYNEIYGRYVDLFYKEKHLIPVVSYEYTE